MVHTTLTSELPFNSRSRRHYKIHNLYQVTVNGEDGEYYEWQIEADNYGEASAKGEEFARDLMVDIQYIEAYQLH